MHRTLRWAAATAATGVVLVVAAHSAGAAAGTSSPEPSCELVRQQARALADRYELASSQASTYAQSVMRSSELTGQRATPEQTAEIVRLRQVAEERIFLLDAHALGSPRCFAADDVEMARRSVQQLALELAGV
ncbi:hypothetical protein ACUN7V_03810 [Quadrisphaera oryzae]|uniref:hypothetical protein n=1 Tax=Quadrisphaera TaxID=317661 RepID=UPI00164491C2|nr:hypothetical protein [Quadrisphaera sp. RL12-1S]MBC3761991.1 hypothetical protein [Quadrisphaera sp. RL12-1S]